ncbi:MAG: 30S ribosomal protein S15 [Elusimicrobia bacterium]|jgi:small subunit ribosomal protein S15|nr:30S ribosomal protein S15 [Elusimicrobiota bacterium]
MSITKEKKKEVIENFSRDKNDTGSPEVQIAILTERIIKLTSHMQENPKDFHSRYGLLKLVSRRRKLLKYLKERDTAKYEEILKELNIRK